MDNKTNPKKEWKVSSVPMHIHEDDAFQTTCEKCQQREEQERKTKMVFDTLLEAIDPKNSEELRATPYKGIDLRGGSDWITGTPSKYCSNIFTFFQTETGLSFVSDMTIDQLIEKLEL